MWIIINTTWAYSTKFQKENAFSFCALIESQALFVDGKFGYEQGLSIVILSITWEIIAKIVENIINNIIFPITFE